MFNDVNHSAAAALMCSRPPPPPLSSSLMPPTMASASFPSTTGSTAAYCSTAPSYMLAEAGGSICGGGAHDMQLSRSASTVALGDECGSASIVSRLRAAAASRRSLPLLLRSHAVPPMLRSTGDLSECESPSPLPQPLSAGAATATRTPTAATSLSSSASPGSYHLVTSHSRSPSCALDTTASSTPPSTPPPPPSRLWCSGAPLLGQVRQRCRAATTLAQLQVNPSRSPPQRANAAAASPPSPQAAAAAAAVVALPLSLSPTFASRAALASAVSSTVPADHASPAAARQSHWSKRARAPVDSVVGVVAADGRQSSSVSLSEYLSGVRSPHETGNDSAPSDASLGATDLSQDGGSAAAGLHPTQSRSQRLDAVVSAPGCALLASRTVAWSPRQEAGLLHWATDRRPPAPSPLPVFAVGHTTDPAAAAAAVATRTCARQPLMFYIHEDGAATAATSHAAVSTSPSLGPQPALLRPLSSPPPAPALGPASADTDDEVAPRVSRARAATPPSTHTWHPQQQRRHTMPLFTVPVSTSAQSRFTTNHGANALAIAVGASRATATPAPSPRCPNVGLVTAALPADERRSSSSSSRGVRRVHDGALSASPQPTTGPAGPAPLALPHVATPRGGEAPTDAAAVRDTSAPSPSPLPLPLRPSGPPPPVADTAVLLVVPRGVASVASSTIAAMTSCAGEMPSWGDDASADAVLALVEEATTTGATQKVVTCFPVHRSVLAQSSAYFAALLGSPGSPYVRSTPDEHVCLADVPAEAETHSTGAATTADPALSRRPPPSRAAAAAPPAAIERRSCRYLPVFYMPTPARAADDDDDDELIGVTAEPAPTLSHSCVCQLLHYLYTGVLPLFHQLSTRTAGGSRTPFSAAWFADVQPETLQTHVAGDYAALLWLALYMDLSSLTTAMLKLLWRLLALTRDVWPYWRAAVRWRVGEMQSVCEAWMERHVCAVLRSCTTRGLWRGLRVDQLRLLVRLRRVALEVQHSAMISDQSTQHSVSRTTTANASTVTGGGNAGADVSVASITSDTTPSSVRDVADRSNGPRGDDGATAVAVVGATVAPARRPASPATATLWHNRPPAWLSRPAAAAGVAAAARDGHTARPATEATAMWHTVSAPALHSPLTPEPLLPPPVAVSSLALPQAVGALASAPTAATPLSPLGASIGTGVQPLWSAGVHWFGAAAATPTQGSPSSTVLTFDDVAEVDGAAAMGGSPTDAVWPMPADSRRPRAGVGLRGGGGSTGRSAGAPSARAGVVSREATLPGVAAAHGTGAAPRSPSAASSSATQHTAPPAQLELYSPRTPSPMRRRLRGVPHDTGAIGRPGASPPLSPAWYTPPSAWTVIPPALQLLADGAWRIGGCGRLYTTETREELERRQAYWYHAEREQQQQHLSAALLTDADLLVRLWTWWQARLEDTRGGPVTAAEESAVAGLLREVRLDNIADDDDDDGDGAHDGGVAAVVEDVRRFLDGHTTVATVRRRP
ncbi:hypothetical protein NESM_000686900 [Novymonas esmeraldas]|uniref:BTB domain-containing protein n=1 Tax=Novymonas esmeraldas TaxID=1808958 RepID=A0AAW0EWD0_9TRYP